MRVSVIVPSYRRPQDLERCLAALGRQVEPPAEILVVLRPEDAAGHAVATASDRPPLRVIEVKRPGQVAALNAGRAAASGEILAFTDDDAEPIPEWTQRIRAHFEADPKLGGLGGRDLCYVDGVLVVGDVAHVGRITWYGRHEGRHNLRSIRQEVEFLKGVNMAYRAEALGTFDERLLGAGAQVCNDLEASLAVRHRGWRLLYDPEVAVRHNLGERHDEDGRAERPLSALAAEQHNELYAMLKNRPRREWPFLLGYRFLIGYRIAPGLAWGLAHAVQSRRPCAEMQRLARLTCARVSAIRTLLS